jgi:CheY-like chemotaxis protein
MNTLLLVDHQNARRRTLDSVLASLGCRAVDARTPLDAIVMLQSGARVDGVIVASELCSVSGRGFSRFLSAEFPALPVAVLTEPWELEDIAAFVCPHYFPARVRDRDLATA